MLITSYAYSLVQSQEYKTKINKVDEKLSEKILYVDDVFHCVFGRSARCPGAPTPRSASSSAQKLSVLPASSGRRVSSPP